LVRDDLSPIEEAKAYVNRWQLMGNKVQINLSECEIAGELSKKLPKDKRTIMMRISLLKLPESVQNAVHLGKIHSKYEYIKNSF